MKNLTVYFDNDVPAHLFQLDDENSEINSRILKSFQSGSLVLYLSLDLIDEAISIVDSSSSDKLMRNMSLLRKLKRGRWLNTFEEILNSELSSNLQVFAPNSLSISVEQTLEKVTEGHVPSGAYVTAGRLREEKERWISSYQGIQEQLRKRKQKIRKKEEFEQFYEDLYEKGMFIRIIEDLQINEPEYQWKRISGNRKQYPYWETTFRVYAAMLYRYFVQNRNIKREPGSYDWRHLIYMHGLDCFITGDRRLSETFELVFPAELGKEVITPGCLIERCLSQELT